MLLKIFSYFFSKSVPDPSRSLPEGFFLLKKEKALVDSGVLMEEGAVIRIVAGIFHEVGLLPGEALVEVGRAGLVAQYEGQTA